MNEYEYRSKVLKHLARMRWEQFENKPDDFLSRVTDWHIAEVKKAIDEYKIVHFCQCDFVQGKD